MLQYDLIKPLIHLFLLLSVFILSLSSLYSTFSMCCVTLTGGDECVCVVFQGRIMVTGLLDRERGDMYTLTVVADDGGPKKDSTVVRYIHNLCLSHRIDFITDYAALLLL